MDYLISMIVYLINFKGKKQLNERSLNEWPALNVRAIDNSDRMSHNVTFFTDTRKLRKPNDFKCDNMGAWRSFRK